MLECLGFADDELAALMHPLDDRSVVFVLGEGRGTERISKVFWTKVATAFYGVADIPLRLLNFMLKINNEPVTDHPAIL